MNNDEYEVTCIDGPRDFPTTISWVRGYALADYALRMRALGWRRVEARLVEDAAPTPRFTGANAAAFLHLLAFALNASTDNRLDSQLTGELRTVRCTGELLTPIARRQCRQHHVSFTVHPAAADNPIDRLSAAFDQVLAARAKEQEVAR